MLLYKIFFELIRSLGRVVHYAIPVSYRVTTDVINDHFCDKKLGIETSLTPLLKKGSGGSMAGACKDGTRYEAITNRRLDALAKTLNVSDTDVFVDLGCGKGRVVFFMSTCKLKKAVGVEFDECLAGVAKRNLSTLKVPHSPVEVIRADAADFDSSEVTIYYMYNPFGWQTMEKVLTNIQSGLLAHPRPIRIFYFNPLCRDLLSSQNWLKYEGECSATGAAMWKNR